jgi:membrane associated rhomboid family serine protease
MIPLKDDAPRITTPYMTWLLLAVNLGIYCLEWMMRLNYGRGALDGLVRSFGLVPVRVTILLAGGEVPLRLVHQLGAQMVTPAAALLPFFTSMFLHGSWLHVIVNMWALWIFGDNVEDHLGHFTYLLMYLLCGLAGGMTHTLLNLASSVPSVGASGAIAGIMGAYFVLYPSARVLTLVPFFFVFFVWLPAWIVLGYWFVVQFLSGAATSISASNPGGGGVAFWAHVGGFVAGLVLIRLFPSRPRRYHYGI